MKALHIQFAICTLIMSFQCSLSMLMSLAKLSTIELPLHVFLICLATLYRASLDPSFLLHRILIKCFPFNTIYLSEPQQPLQNLLLHPATHLLTHTNSAPDSLTLPHIHPGHSAHTPQTLDFHNIYLVSLTHPHSQRLYSIRQFS